MPLQIFGSEEREAPERITLDNYTSKHCKPKFPIFTCKINIPWKVQVSLPTVNISARGQRTFFFGEQWASLHFNSYLSVPSLKYIQPMWSWPRCTVPEERERQTTSESSILYLENPEYGQHKSELTWWGTITVAAAAAVSANAGGISSSSFLYSHTWIWLVSIQSKVKENKINLTTQPLLVWHAVNSKRN